MTSAGVLLLRLAGVLAVDKARMVSSVIAAHASELAGAFTVVSPGSIRIRRGFH